MYITQLGALVVLAVAAFARLQPVEQRDLHPPAVDGIEYELSEELQQPFVNLIEYQLSEELQQPFVNLIEYRGSEELQPPHVDGFEYELGEELQPPHVDGIEYELSEELQQPFENLIEYKLSEELEPLSPEERRHAVYRRSTYPSSRGGSPPTFRRTSGRRVSGYNRQHGGYSNHHNSQHGHSQTRYRPQHISSHSSHQESPYRRHKMAAESDATLVQPELELCQNRHAKKSDSFSIRGSYYYLSDFDYENVIENTATNRLATRNFTWLEGRNECRRRCMDAVSIETPTENSIIVETMQQKNISELWTSGRLCDSEGCKGRIRLLPTETHGWFWSGSKEMILGRDAEPVHWKENPWSSAGKGKYLPKSCLMMVQQADGEVKWHDRSCDLKTSVLCEDSPELINYIEQIYNITMSSLP